MRANEITEAIIGAAIEVHRALGPGLRESAYEECLCQELQLRQVLFERQAPLPVKYKGKQLDCGFRLDLPVAGQSPCALVRLIIAAHLQHLSSAYDCARYTYVPLFAAVACHRPSLERSVLDWPCALRRRRCSRTCHTGERPRAPYFSTEF